MLRAISGISALLLITSSLNASPVRVLSAGEEGLLLEVETRPQVRQVERDGQRFHELEAPGHVRLAAPGQPALPFVAELLAVPAGAQVWVEVVEEQCRQLDGIDLAPAPRDPAENELSRYEPDPQYYQRDAWLPEQRALAQELGRLRGVRALSLRLHPFRYNPARRVLEVCDRLRVRVHFAGGQRAKTASSVDTPAAAPLYRAFLNPDQATAWRAPVAAKPVASEWYDPSRPWVKVFVEEDALFRIDAAWLDSLGIDPASIDPHTLQVLYRGEEQAVYVQGEADGRLDAGDFLLFHGLYRREENKDFEHLYGRRKVYWLTWGQEQGKRLVERSGAPVNDYPLSEWYWATAHFEQDVRYDPLPSTPPEKETDHFFWDEPVTAVEPDEPSSKIYAQPLPYPDPGEEYTARVRVALHGISDQDHHTVVRLNGHLLDEGLWRGAEERLIQAEISSSLLKANNNRLTLLAYAPNQESPDQVYFNWFAIEYRRNYQTWSGYLAFPQPPGGQRHAVKGFSSSQVEVWDVASGVRFTGVEVDSLDGLLTAVFEGNPAVPASYAVADSAGTKIPRGQVDKPSAWRAPGHSADYLIITHADFLEAANRLAAHRRSQGLEVEVVEVEDLYDEFADGLLDPGALRAFIEYAYRFWEKPPAYVLLAGSTHYDYRRHLGSRSPSFVPTLYYHSRRRGQAGNDFLFSLLDGEDLLPELAVGRLSFSTPEEAMHNVEKIIRYDRAPEPGDWRSRAIFLANYHDSGQFTRPSDELAARYIEPLGLEAIKIYNPDDSFIPNPTGKKFLDALNAGALLLNFNGHGSIGTLQYVFTIQFSDWGYLSQVRNGGRLPLVLALSCLNGQFVDPVYPSLSEAFTIEEDGGAIAYISASAQSFVSQNDLLADRLFARFFQEGELEFGPGLNAAKVQVLAAHPSFEDVVLTMQLMGDPAQELALPREADYTPVELRLAEDQVFSQDTLRLEAVLRNNTRLTPDSLEVELVALQEEAAPETLLATTEGPFAGTRTLSVNWPVRGRLGPLQFELRVDPAGRVRETDEGNNRLGLGLEILAAVVPALLFPAAGGVVAPAALSLEALLPLSDGPFACQFALSTSPLFAEEGTRHSALLTAVEGKAEYQPQGLTSGQSYFWRARGYRGAAAGPWSEGRSFQLEAQPSPPQWQQRGAQLLSGQAETLALDGERLTLSPATLPLRPASATREDGFTVLELKGAGVLCTDGTYLYAKRWFNDSSTVYPGTDFFARIGTGFNNTQRGQFYGVLADSTTAGISATYHSDGYLYSEMGQAFALERLSTTTGRKDTVAVPEGLLDWKTGQLVDGHALITSDGRYIYNVAMSSEAGMRTEWKARVFDPAQGWALVREFKSPPTENGFTFMWTDGILADGERLYFIEYGGGRRIRMVDARDGRFLDEWQSDQEITRIISGQYDWTNNKVWLGELFGSGIFRYQGLQKIDRGQLVSAPVGPAASWGSLRARGQGEVEVELLGRDAQSGEWQSLPGFAGLPLDRVVELGAVDAGRYPLLRLRARLQGGNSSLDAWELDFAPRASLRLERAEADSLGQIQVVVRNVSAVEAGARLRLEQGGAVVRELSLTPLARGEVRRVQIDSLVLPPPGVRLLARLLQVQPDADPADDLLEVSLQRAGRAALGFWGWPGGRPFLDGDPLAPGEGLLVQADGEGRLVLAVDGAPAQPDSTWGGESPGLLYRPVLAPGEHQLQVRLFQGQREAGIAELRFRLSERFAIANPLLYPHPVRERTAFTYVLSHPAEVWVEVYSLSGRRVARLGPLAQQAGFQQVAWDGRDQEGRLLANGAYLYRIAGVDARGQRAEFAGPFSVVR